MLVVIVAVLVVALMVLVVVLVVVVVVVVLVLVLVLVLVVLVVLVLVLVVHCTALRFTEMHCSFKRAIQHSQTSQVCESNIVKHSHSQRLRVDYSSQDRTCQV